MTLDLKGLQTVVLRGAMRAKERKTATDKLKDAQVIVATGKYAGEGFEQFDQDGVTLKIYSPEKTLADCFKYRNKIGMDTVLEALRFYRERKEMKIDLLLHYARICRVEKVIRPYLEVSL